MRELHPDQLLRPLFVKQMREGTPLAFSIKSVRKGVTEEHLASILHTTTADTTHSLCHADLTERIHSYHRNPGASSIHFTS